MHYFKASKPWEKSYFTPSVPSKKPSELSHDELEEELVDQLFATQKQKYGFSLSTYYNVSVQNHITHFIFTIYLDD